MLFRMYLPEIAVLNCQYELPGIVRSSGAVEAGAK